jgi:hypothetical protein
VFWPVTSEYLEGGLIADHVQRMPDGGGAFLALHYQLTYGPANTCAKGGQLHQEETSQIELRRLPREEEEAKSDEECGKAKTSPPTFKPFQKGRELWNWNGFCASQTLKRARKPQ